MDGNSQFPKTGRSTTRQVHTGRGLYPTNPPGNLPGAWQWSTARGKQPGKIEDDSYRSDHNPEKTQTYKSCPETVKVVESYIKQSEDQEENGSLSWQLGNLSAPNCCGWALGILEKSGFKVTNDPRTPHLRPHWID
jgi:hypothetical protein